MLAHPTKNQRVIIRYAKERKHHFPYHGMTGTVVISAKGRGPLNHLIQIDNGPLVIVPCGNLVKVKLEALAEHDSQTTSVFTDEQHKEIL